MKPNSSDTAAKYLLDSDSVIDYLAGIQRSVSLIQALGEGGVLCLCDVVIAEVYSGLRPQDRQAAQTLLDGLLYLPTTAAAARQAGEWRYQYARQGIALSTTDMLIAAAANEHAATIVTGNSAHYPIPELSLLLLPRGSPETRNEKRDA